MSLEPESGPERVGGMSARSSIDDVAPPDTGPRRPVRFGPPLPSPSPAPTVVETDEMTEDGHATVSVNLEFDAFYRSARPVLARALALSLGDLDVATEATDEALTRAYERWSSVSVLEKPEAWVYRVASNWATSIFRKRRLSLHRLYQPEPGEPTFADPQIHAAVAALDVKHRSVVVCRHLLGWSVAETAVALGVNEGTVKSRLHRASATLRTQLQHHDTTPTDSTTSAPDPSATDKDLS